MIKINYHVKSDFREIDDEPEKLTFVKRSFGAKFPYLRIPLAKNKLFHLLNSLTRLGCAFLRVLIYLKVFFCQFSSTVKLFNSLTFLIGHADEPN